jgi:6-phosphogluconate dehydrogenase (decarboxylating)
MFSPNLTPCFLAELTINPCEANASARCGAANFADKVLSVMRYEFGGHIEKKA